MTETYTFWEHAAELRNTLIKVLFIILLGVTVAFCYYQEVFSLLTYPLRATFDNTALQRQEIRKERIYNPGPNERHYIPPGPVVFANSSKGTQELGSQSYLIPPGEHLEIEIVSPGNKLVILGPLDGFMAGLKTSFWVGLVGTSPIWLFFILQFLIPALQPNERRLLVPFLILSCLFLIFGLLFAFFITLPAANSYLQTFNQGIGINLWSIESYMSYTVTLLLANAFAFEMFVVLLCLVHFGILNAKGMISKRRHMIVAAFIIGALLTPPDVLTQLLLAFPLIGLYELAILYARFLEKKRYLART